MSIETGIACASFGVALVNAAASALIYVRYMRSVRGVFCMLTADEDGEIKTSEFL